ncbi:PA14 domain-containing protein, partial [Flavobacterium granuli]
MKKKYSLLLLFFIFFLVPRYSANAQVGPADFEFWYGVPAWGTSPAIYNSPQKLHLTNVSSTAVANYRIDMPADGTFNPITGTIAAGGSQVVDMTPYIAAITVAPANTVKNKGLRIQVWGQMGAYYANETTNNYGTMPLRGPNALGTSFIVPGQNIANIGTTYTNATTSFVVTATEDNTAVTIVPSEAITGHGANVPFTITLMKGQSYSASTTAKAGKHLGGSLVNSTAPVVVTYSDDLIGSLTSAYDNAGDQLIPISKFGLEYVQVRTNLVTVGDESVFIFGSQDGTTVTVFDGTTTTTLVVNKGQFVRYFLPNSINAASIKADKPVMVYQMGGAPGTNNNSEFGGGILTPISDCKGAKAISFEYPSTTAQTFFNFVAPNGTNGTTDITNSFKFNGNTIPLTFVPIPGIPGWSYCRRDVTANFSTLKGQVINITNTAGKFYFYQNIKTPGGGDFSNFSDFGNVVLFPKAEYTCGDATNTIKLKNGAIAFNITIPDAGYSWTGPNGYTSTDKNPVISNVTAANMGTYTLTVIDINGCSYTETVELNLPVNSLTVTPTPSTACIGSTVHFTSVSVPSDAVVQSVLWTGPNGFTSSQANFDITGVTQAQAGTYTCKYTDKYGCVTTRTTDLAVNSIELKEFSVSGTPRISCANPNSTLTVTDYSNGLDYQTYANFKATSLVASGDFKTIVSGFYNQEPTNKGTIANPIFTGLIGITGTSTSFGVKYKGFIKITTAGTYTFYLNSKDGSNLYIDGSSLIGNDGSHAATEVASSTTLSAGLHAIEVNYFNGASGNPVLGLSYMGPDSVAKSAIPAAAFYHASGTPPAGLTYTWTNDYDGSSTTGTSITASKAGTYTVTGTNGTCSSSSPFTVSLIDSYDYGDLSSPWPVAQAKIVNCLTAGIPSGSNTAVWAGAAVSIESAPLSNATATADSNDDGFISPTSTGGAYTVVLNSNTSGTTGYYGLWFDWNNDGDFTNDVDASGQPAFYSGSASINGPTSVLVTATAPAGAKAVSAKRLIVSDIPVTFTAFDDIFQNGEVEDYSLVLNLSGKVFDDANGLKGSPVNTVDGTGTNAGGLFAVLVNSSGKVVANATVAADGTYNFISLAAGTYSIVLSTTQGTIGATAPVASLPATWTSMGEYLGAAAGNDGTANGILTGVVVSSANVVNANFSINRLPVADDKIACSVDPGGATKLAVPILTGSDAEDGTYNGSSSTDSIKIVSVSDAVLYYDDIVVTLGLPIVNYNPNLLKIDPNNGSVLVSFTYSEIDASGSVSSPATVTVNTVYAGVDLGVDPAPTATATMAATGSGTWTANPGNPVATSIVSATDPLTQISGFTTNGVYIYTWTATNGCTDEVKVLVPIPKVILAVDDTGTAVNGYSGGTAFTNVLLNDTLDGAPATDGTGANTGTVIVSFVESTIPEITLSGTDVVVAPGTPAGNYTLVYSICEKINNTNCTTATVTVAVSAAAIVAIDEIGSCVDEVTGGTSFTNILTNDTLNGGFLNGVVVDPSKVTIEEISSTNDGVSLSGSDVVVAAGTPAGTYTLTYKITELLNSGNSDTAIVTVNVTPVKPTIASVGATCSAVGTSTISNYKATNTYNFNPSGPTVDSTGLVSGMVSDTSYTMTASNGNASCTSADSDSFSNAAMLITPIANAGSDFTKTCTQNATGLAIGTTAVAGTTYAWSPAADFTDATVSNPTANPTVNTTYTVTATNTASGCTATDTVVVTVDTTSAVADAGSDFTKTCTQNATGLAIGATAVSGTTYAWSPSTGLSSATASNPTANPTANTTYTVTATNTASGCTATDTVVVTVETTSAVADAGSDFTKTCTQNATGLAIGATAVSGTTYAWSPSTGLSSATASNPTANPTATTTYTVTATNTASGCTATDTVVVTVETTSAVADAGSDFTKTCTQNATGLAIGATAVSGTTYAWSPSTGLSSATASNPTANPTTNTTYTVTATNTASGCTATDTVVVTVETTSAVADAGSDFTKTCTQNATGLAIGATAVSGTTYAWSPSTGLSSATASNPTANPTANTTYTVTATNTASGCTATDTVVVTVETTSAVADAGSDFTKTCTQNATGLAIGATAVSGTTYAWSPSTGLSSATASNPTANPTANTTYTVTATNTASGCTATDTVVVTVDTTSAVADAGSDFTKTCTQNATGLAIGATAVSGTTYAWSPSTELSSATASNP